MTVRSDIYAEGWKAELEQISPSRLVPLLNVDGASQIWDSMAISVWCAERYPQVRLWPDGSARSLAGAVRRRARCTAASGRCATTAAWGRMPVV
jgi:glutathione S-transferase